MLTLLIFLQFTLLNVVYQLLGFFAFSICFFGIGIIIILMLDSGYDNGDDDFNSRSQLAV